jgi:tol-pal system protein YbgF
MRAPRTAAVALAAWAGAGCFATTKEHQALRDDVTALQAEFTSVRASFNESREKLVAELTRADEKIAQVERALGEIEKFTSSRFGEQFLQFEQALASLQQLRGQVEETQHALQQIRGELGDLRGQIEAVRIEGGAGGATGAASGGGAAPGGTPPPSTDEGPPPDDPKAWYEVAYKALREGRGEESRKLLQGFLAKWPEDALTDNAQYWLGESYYVESRYQNAILEFQRVIEKYPKSDKVPDALLKLGMSFGTLGLCDEAKAFYEEVTARHRKSPVARAAKGKLDTLGKDCKAAGDKKK